MIRAALPSGSKKKGKGRGFTAMILPVAVSFLVALCSLSIASSQGESPDGTVDTESTVPGEQIRGDLYAVVVGVSKYKHPNVPGLEVSDKDAKAFADFLTTQEKLFSKVHLTLLLNEQATTVEVHKHLFHNIRRAGKNDTVALFFSGHGSSRPDIPGEYFFLTHDADPEFLEATAVKMTGMRFLRGLDSKRVVVIADTSHAGLAKVTESKSVQPGLSNLLRQFKESAGRAIISSCRPDEISLDEEALGKSIFTHYLLEALKGAADKDSNGIVTIEEAYDYVYQQTKNRTRGRQHPQFEGGVEGAFPVSYVGPTGTRLKLVTDPPGVNAYVKTKSGFEFADKSNEQGRLVLKDIPLNMPVTVRLSKAGWKTVILDPISFSENGREVEHPLVKLSPALSFLVLQSDPSTVAVSLDGEPVGVTDDDNLLILNGVQVGVPHEITFGKKGFRERKVTITVPVRYEGKVYKAASVALREKAADVAMKMPSKRSKEGLVGNAGKQKAPAALAREELLAKLFDASREGDIKTLTELLKRKVHLDVRDRRGWTPLMHAASGNHAKAASALLAAGADVNARGDFGWTALMLATGKGNTEMVKLLLAKGADAKAKDVYGQTALMKPATAGHEKILKLLGKGSRAPVSRAGSRVETTAVASQSAKQAREFIEASRNGDVGKVRKILREGVEVDVRDQLGWTALMYACAYNHLTVALVLLEMGADVNGTNKLGWSPLMIAAGNGHEEAVNLLLDRGADKEARNIYGETAAMKASIGKHKGVLRLLGLSPKPSAARRSAVTTQPRKAGDPVAVEGLGKPIRYEPFIDALSVDDRPASIYVDKDVFE